MELMVEGGRTPAEVLTAATAGGARLLGLLGNVGTIGPGKRADLLVRRANPLIDVRNVRDVEWILKGGHLIGHGPSRCTVKAYPAHAAVSRGGPRSVWAALPGDATVRSEPSREAAALRAAPPCPPTLRAHRRVHKVTGRVTLSFAIGS
jgi:cytosine/adenosine deaminase-related metal-dependent hydrolase